MILCVHRVGKRLPSPVNISRGYQKFLFFVLESARKCNFTILVRRNISWMILCLDIQLYIPIYCIHVDKNNGTGIQLDENLGHNVNNKAVDILITNEMCVNNFPLPLRVTVVLHVECGKRGGRGGSSGHWFVPIPAEDSRIVGLIVSHRCALFLRVQVRAVHRGWERSSDESAGVTLFPWEGHQG